MEVHDLGLLWRETIAASQNISGFSGTRPVNQARDCPKVTPLVLSFHDATKVSRGVRTARTVQQGFVFLKGRFHLAETCGL